MTPEIKRLSTEPSIPKVKTILDLVETKIEESRSKGINDRITEPFEARIDKMNLTLEDIKRISKLPIEVLLAHDTSGNLILSTGSKGSIEYDFGDEYNQRLELGKKKWLDQTEQRIEEIKRTNGKFEETDEDILFFKEHHKFTEERLKRMQNDQSWTMHNHPAGSTSLPSISDLYAYSASDAKQHFIFSKESVSIIYKFDKSILDKIDSFLPEYRELFSYEKEERQRRFKTMLDRIGIKIEVISFDDPKISEVLQTIKGNYSE